MVKAKGIDIYAKIDWEKAGTLFRRLEEEDKRQKRERQQQRVETTKAILAMLAAAGTVGLIFAFPAMLPAIGAVIRAFRSVSWREKRILNRLARQNWVELKENPDGTTTVRITKAGLTRALTYALDDMAIKTPKKWDEKWRVVIFDIPEKYRRLRDVFRMRLEQLGLTMLQESVFVSPYPSFNEVEFLRQLYGVAISVRYLLVERIEDDLELREKYKL